MLDFSQEPDDPGTVQRLLSFLQPKPAQTASAQPGSLLRFNAANAPADWRVPMREPMAGSMPGQEPSSRPLIRFAPSSAPRVPEEIAAPQIDGSQPRSLLSFRQGTPAMPEPTWSDFPVQQMPAWKKILGAAFSTMAGTGNPNAAGRTAEAFFGGPKAKAEEKYQQAEKEYQQRRNGQAQDQAAETATPEARRAFLQSNPDLFQGVSDFEKNDYILSGKFPQREPTQAGQQKAAKPEVIETSQGPLQWNADKNAWEPVKVNGQPVAAKATEPKENKAVAGTLDGKPAWGVQTEKGWIDPQTQKPIPNFAPTPSFAETGYYEPVEVPTPNGGMAPAIFDRRTGKTTLSPTNNAPIPREAAKPVDEALGTARGMDRLEGAQKDILAAVEKRGDKGPMGGGPYLNGPESMQFVANHIAMTFGAVKGARVGRDLIEQHVQARDLDQATEAAAQKVLSGGIITYSQAQQMMQTAAINRKRAWQQAKDAATQYGVPDAVRMPADLGGPKNNANGALPPRWH